VVEREAGPESLEVERKKCGNAGSGHFWNALRRREMG